MNPKALNIIMAGMLTFLGSIPLPLLSADGRHRLTHSDCSDYVFITGQTNVNQFDFLYSRNDFAMVHQDDSGNYEIKIPVRDFKPGNPFMYSDFLTLLKADEYPFINITIPSDQLNLDTPGTYISTPLVKITIAGVTRSYLLNCSVQKCSEGVSVAGSEPIKLSDFQLKKVERLGGLIKLSDVIDVSFGFIVTFTPANQITSTR